jgi:Mg2+/Co2+ transporter CorB
MLEICLIIIAIFLPLLLSCLLSASETAITAMSIAKIHKLKNDGNKKAAIVSKLREDKESLISTILLANNACNILSSTITTALLIDFFGAEGVIYSTLIMTILVIVFAEVLPKTYSIANPEKVALNFAHFLQIVVAVCRPITIVINYIVEFMIRVFKLDNHSSLVSATEEIKGAIDLHHQEGGVDQSDKYMLDGVFYLGESQINDVMTHRKNMLTINIDLSIEEVAEQVKHIKHSRIPMWKDKQDNIVGVLNVKDLLQLFLSGKKLNEIDIKDIISEPVFAHENTALDEQLSLFKTHKTRFAIVIDEYGDIQGLITLSDILEEVVGRMQDEYDVEKEEIEWHSDNICIICGETPIRDLNRMFNWQLHEGEASTVAGLVIHEAERIPELGECFEFYGYKFTILDKDNNQITKIKIEKL